MTKRLPNGYVAISKLDEIERLATEGGQDIDYLTNDPPAAARGFMLARLARKLMKIIAAKQEVEHIIDDYSD